jgi:hypothetical protein
MKLFTKTVELTFVEIDGKEFKWSEVSEVLTALEGTDGFMEYVLIDNDDLADVLEALDALNRNARGSQFKGPKFESVRDELYNLRHPGYERTEP